MSTATATVRRVEVRPPSSRIEFGNVVRFSMVVVAGAWMFLAANGGALRDTDGSARHLLPFQKLIQDRPPIEQRMFRELQEGLLEAESRRASPAAWRTRVAGARPGAGARSAARSRPRRRRASPAAGRRDAARLDLGSRRCSCAGRNDPGAAVGRVDATLRGGTVVIAGNPAAAMMDTVAQRLQLSEREGTGPGRCRYDPSTRQASISDVTHNAVPPSMNVITTTSHKGR